MVKSPVEIILENFKYLYPYIQIKDFDRPFVISKPEILIILTENDELILYNDKIKKALFVYDDLYY